ncbi:MAG: type II toxin-antitoxin system RelE/ParE family toxin [Parahaliea sp.]
MTKEKNPYRIAWRPMAEADLDKIIDYIAQDNPTRAETFGKELCEKTRSLAQHPELGRTGRPGLPSYVRELVAHPNYIVFYRVWDETCTVEILRVKHSTQRTPHR